MSYVCAYSSVQLDKSRVEKEFTYNTRSLEHVQISKRQTTHQTMVRMWTVEMITVTFRYINVRLT